MSFKELVDKKKRSGGTLRHWRTTRRKIHDFIIFKFELDDIPLVDIKESFAEHFYDYLTVSVPESLAENTALKHVSKAKQILKRAKKKKLIKENPIGEFSCYCQDPEVEPLEIYEVDKIYRKSLPIQRLDQARDGFIFQCFTGFAFQDIRDLLTLDHIIHVGVNGERWLIKKRGKTDVFEMVPILPIIEELIKKYENHPCRILHTRLIPIFSNANYNGYLKEIAAICGINRELKTHLARHTFADIIINVLGMDLEDLMRMLGHKNIRTTQRYVKIRKIRISRNIGKTMKILFDKHGKLKPIKADYDRKVA
ncbi:site-specific integrase [Pedobacter lusitanus]|uniref:site-specific integrase n=1 Tax=Pedobacter lusitanus TaxID=1503925 RepID=UPI000697406C|nr:site-specific integrase [Pedobacter lusitanus]